MTDARAFYESLQTCLAAGEAPAVATIVRVKGSSPREVGAKMLVRPGGTIDGTVGGGCGEADVWRAALDTIADGEPRTVVVDLTQEIALDTDGVCGGIMDIYVERWSPPSSIPSQLIEAIGLKQSAVLATIVEAPESTHLLGQRVLLRAGEASGDGSAPAAVQAAILGAMEQALSHGTSRTVYIPLADDTRTNERIAVYYEPCLPRPSLIIVGAGHVAVPIAQVGAILDFEVTVIDDRASFANQARFPTADQIIVDDFEAALESIHITSSTYVVLVTRGHAHDVRSLRKIIHQPAAYIGMIGSRRRVYAVFKLLHDEGVPIDTVLRVRAPIGLDIKTETPGEIALSVGAEILKVRRGGGATSFSDMLRDQYRASLVRGSREPTLAV